jgi:hypothetical protein
MNVTAPAADRVHRALVKAVPMTLASEINILVPLFEEVQACVNVPVDRHQTD